MDPEMYAAESLGRRVVDHPFRIRSVLAFPVIPRHKVTDRGPFDADRFEFIPLRRT